jgi:hydroxymethylpyrimidine/phosphomethylpyrimidine kinase
MRSTRSEQTAHRVSVALTVAGSDSGGGAGIQADLKTFAALGVYGCSVITALTAQNTLGVQGVETVEPSFVRQQLDSVLSDFEVGAVKTGMLGTAEIVDAVAEGLLAWRAPRIVVDPVMVAKGGHRLLRDEAIEAVRARLLPLAFLISPNLPEVGALLGVPPPREREEMEAAAERLLHFGPTNVLLKGGHLGGNASPDLLLSSGQRLWLEAERIATRHTHGTGCTLSSAIAALLATGQPLPAAVTAAKRWVTAAISAGQSLHLGHGMGPVHHFHALWAHPAVPNPYG